MFFATGPLAPVFEGELLPTSSAWEPICEIPSSFASDAERKAPPFFVLLVIHHSAALVANSVAKFLS